MEIYNVILICLQSEQAAESEEPSETSENKADAASESDQNDPKVDGQVRIEVEGEEADSIEQRGQGEGESVSDNADELTPEESNKQKYIEKRK